MKDSAKKPTTADEYLCSVELHSPSQERHSDRFNLFATLAFDVREEEIRIEDCVRTVCYGFHEAEVRLGISGCTIAPTGRLEEMLKPQIVKTQKIQDSGRQGEVRGGLDGGAILKKFGLDFAAKGALSGAVSHKITEEGETQYECAVIKPYGKYWRVFGVKDTRGILNGRIMGEQPLCTIEHKGRSAKVDVSVKASIRRLWVALDDGEPDPADANRKAVVGLLVARSLRDDANPQALDSNEVVLAKHSISVLPIGGEPNGQA